MMGRIIGGVLGGVVGLLDALGNRGLHELGGLMGGERLGLRLGQGLVARLGFQPGIPGNDSLTVHAVPLGDRVHALEDGLAVQVGQALGLVID